MLEPRLAFAAVDERDDDRPDRRQRGRAAAIASRELGKEITADYADRPPLLVGVLKGAFVFMSDLSRAIDLPVEFDFMAVSSYGSATRTSGVVRIIKDLDLDLTDRHVLIVEDIVDSGLTLAYLRKNLAARGPASLEVCALLVKEGLQRVELDLKYVGFTHPARRSSSATASTSASATATCPYIAEYAGPNRSERPRECRSGRKWRRQRAARLLRPLVCCPEWPCPRSAAAW